MLARYLTLVKLLYLCAERAEARAASADSGRPLCSCCCAATVLLFCCCCGATVLAVVLLCCCGATMCSLPMCQDAAVVQGLHTGHWPVCGSGHCAVCSVQLRLVCCSVDTGQFAPPVTSVLMCCNIGQWAVCSSGQCALDSVQCGECSVEVWGERAMCRPSQCGTLPPSLLLSAHCTLKDTTMCCFGLCSELH